MISSIYFTINDEDVVNIPIYLEILKKNINDNRIKQIYNYKYKNINYINILLYIDICREVFHDYCENIKILLNYNNNIKYKYTLKKNKEPVRYNFINIETIKCVFIDDDD